MAKRYLRKAIEDEKEAIRVYGNKPKGLNGRVDKIRKDEKRHLKTLQSISKGYRRVS